MSEFLMLKTVTLTVSPIFGLQENVCYTSSKSVYSHRNKFMIYRKLCLVSIYIDCSIGVQVIWRCTKDIIQI